MGQPSDTFTALGETSQAAMNQVDYRKISRAFEKNANGLM
jgi:hypothetical protein